MTIWVFVLLFGENFGLLKNPHTGEYMLSAIVFVRGENADRTGESMRNPIISQTGEENMDFLLRRLREMKGDAPIALATEHWYISALVFAPYLWSKLGGKKIWLGDFVNARGKEVSLEHFTKKYPKSKKKTILVVIGHFDADNYEGRTTATGEYLRNLVRDSPLAGFPDMRLKETVQRETLALIVDFESQEYQILERVTVEEVPHSLSLDEEFMMGL